MVAHEFLHQLLQKADYHVNGNSPFLTSFGGHTSMPYINLNADGKNGSLRDELKRGRCSGSTCTMILPEHQALIHKFLRQ